MDPEQVAGLYQQAASLSSPGGGVPGDLRERDGAGEKWSAWAELAQLVKGVRNLMIIVGMIGIEEELNIY